QITVNTSDNPRKYFNFSIHIPGRGKIFKVAGKIAVKRNGNASPNPIKVNIMKMLNVEVVNAKASAVPRNGAEQGVERIVVKTPVKKSPETPSFTSADPSFAPPGVMNSNRPNRFKLMIKRMSIITRMKAGD